jgi:NADH dehydrogenase
LSGLYQMSFEEPRFEIDFDRCDAVVHLACDRRSGRSDINYRGTVRLAEAAARNGVTRQVFVSSYSARADATSEYGRTKYRLESYFRDAGYEISRPGLVLGNGGTAARIVRAVKVCPILPLPGGGTGEIPFISIAALCGAIRRILERPGDKEHNLFSRHFTTLDQLVRTIRKVVCKDSGVVVVPIPALLMLLGLRFVEMLRLPSPVSVDNLKGFLRNQRRLHESALAALGVKSETLLEALEAANLQ